jgi:hypothetical protein
LSPGRDRDDPRLVGGSGEAGDALKRHRRRPNPPEADARRLLSGEAWADFCAALEAAGRQVLAEGTPDGPRQRAEGFRYLAGLVMAGLQQATLLGDPDRPRWLRNPDSRARWGAENADNQYLWTRIRSDGRYRISGRRGTAHDFLIEVKEGYMQLGDDRNFATLSAHQLACEPDGSFEILASAEEQPGNWLPLHPEARYMAVRQYFYDWEHEEPASFQIAALHARGEAPPPLDPTGAARMLDDAGEWIETSTRFWNEWVAALRSRPGRGELAPARHYVGGADDIRYGNDLYRLDEDEVLLIETALPRARYWAFQLCDLWFQSLDYANRQTSLNGHQARLDADGVFRCVVAHRDPGVPNWLDTAGHREGLIQYRWIWAETSPEPQARVLPFGELRSALPADTPRVTPEQRRAAIRIRQEHIRRREPVA